MILKADVQGSLEAIQEVLKGLPQDKVVLRILKGEVGEINESDLQLARSGGARILGFRVKTNARAVQLAERDNINIMTFDIIYELAQSVRALMEKRMASEKVRVETGQLKVSIVFLTDKKIVKRPAREKSAACCMRAILRLK